MAATQGLDSVLHFSATDSLIYPDSVGGFLAKYDAQGNFLWAAQASDLVNGQTISTDPAGNVIWGGYYFYFASFSGVDLPLDSSFIDLFIVKYTADGSLVWVKKGRTLHTNFSNGGLPQLTTDDSGNIYCTGYVPGDICFGNDTIVNTGVYQAFVAKFDSSGNILWHTTEGHAIYLSSLRLSIALDSKGNVYSGGGVQDSGANNLSPFIAKYNSTGTLRWFKEYTGTTRYGIDGIAVDSNGNAYISGDYRDEIALDSITLTTSTTAMGSVFVAKLDTEGNVMWAQTTKGPYESTNSLSMAIDANSGNIAIAGTTLHGNDTLGTVIFPFVFSSGYIAYISMGIGLSVPTVPHAIQCVIYPNPATSELYINNATAGTMVNVYNVNGQAVYMGQLNSTLGTINIKDFPKGIYFVKMMAPDGAVQEKTFVKE